MKSARVIIDKYVNGYWAVIHPYTDNDKSCFYYETNDFKEIQEVEWEARAFCRWKKLKIRKIIRKYKYREHR